eukprot:Gb_05082 [translate_table: standard]
MYGDCSVLLSAHGNNMGGNIEPFISPSSLLVAQRLLPQLPTNMSLQTQSVFSSSDGLSLAPPRGMREVGQSGEAGTGQLKSKEEEHESKSGSGHMEGGSGEDQDADQQQPRRKRYHRHTVRQIQEMESLFKECPHPDDKQRQRLSIELGLKPRQVKFWFQNRRTQMKAQQDRSDNAILRAQNENLRNENLALREAIKNVVCPNCGGPASLGDMSFDEQHLRLDNARLKEELDRVSSIASKYIGRPISPLAASIAPPMLMSSLDLAMGNFGKQSLLPSTDLVPVPPLADANLHAVAFMELEKPLALELAMNAMEELMRMAQTDEPLWLKNVNGMKDVLSLDEYARQFQWAMGFKHHTLKTEATKDSALVIMNGVALVDVLMDANKWVEMFPSIVSRAKTLQVLAPGVPGQRNGSLQLMYVELQVLSPLVPTREMYFLRYCQQRAEGLWAVVDFSVDSLHDNPPPSLLRYRKRPSGCLIQDMPNGYSKVTWVEHAEAEERAVHRIYHQLVSSGMAFGAQRWLASLQRQCERLASLMASNISARDLGVIPCADGRRSMMKLAQRMTNTFCANISASTSQSWTTLSGSNDDSVRITTRKSTDPGQPSGVVLSAATSLWLPVSPQRVFDFLRDERMRSEWDVLSSGNLVQEVAHIANGSHPGNSISLLRVNACNTSQNVELILQESCTDASGSLVVYAPVDVPAINIAMSGENPSCIALLPSGFAILPDGPSGNRGLVSTSLLHEAAGSSSSTGLDSPRTGGSLLTVAFQVLVSTLPTAKLNLESVTTINNLICNTVQQIKAALHCTDA